NLDADLNAKREPADAPPARSPAVPPRVFVAIGSNLGNPQQTVRAALDRLQELSSAPLVCSSLWKTAPVDCPPGSASFVNAVAGLVPAATETPESLLV